MSPSVKLYQIAYSEDTLASIEPGYLILDNLSNERPDWYEYWPIRRFLLNENLEENLFYGFFSPKFFQKTRFTYSEVVESIEKSPHRADVFLYSSHQDIGALFINIFEQGEAFHPGLLEASKKLFGHINRKVNLQTLVMDSRQTVFSNYFVARPAFWKEWISLNEAIFAASEDPSNPLSNLLNKATSYTGGAQIKVFLIERTASLLLATNDKWRTSAANTLSKFGSEFGIPYICDALKIAMREQGYPEYIQKFIEFRGQFFSELKR